MPDYDHTEDNVGKLISKTNPECSLPREARLRMLSALYDMASKKTPAIPPPRRTRLASHRWLRYVTVACIGAILGVLAYRFWPIDLRQPSPVAPAPPVPMTSSVAVQVSPVPAESVPPANEQTVLMATVRELDAMLAARDVNNLIVSLSTGPDQVRIIAADYLARMGDPAAIPALEAASRGFAGPAKDNPFIRPLLILTRARLAAARPATDSNHVTAAKATASATQPVTRIRDANSRTSARAMQRTTVTIEVARPMPTLRLLAPDGNDIGLSSFRGKRLLVNLWASKKDSIDANYVAQVSAVTKRFVTDPNIRIINLTSHLEPQELAVFVKFLAANGLTNPCIISPDPNNKPTTEAMTAIGVTSSILIGPDGTVLSTRSPMTDQPGNLESDIAAALNSPAPAPQP
jgi:hypothetical protein